MPHDVQVPAAKPDSTTTTPFLVFGYGSLIYKPPPHVLLRTAGYITSHKRRFWQLSQDHRGTPDSPGRVVTLISNEEYASSLTPEELAFLETQGEAVEKTWGVVYEIIPESVAEVKRYLDIREINGYSLHTVLFHPLPASGAGPLEVSVFIGSSDNPQFARLPETDAGLRATAEHIARSSGPSGRNDEYLFLLASALRELNDDGVQGIGDPYCNTLERLVKGETKVEDN